MSWYAIAFLPPQYENASGVPYSGAVLKAYAAGTSTPIAMATSYTGATTAASFALNASGYPVYNSAVVIPHIQENYKLALYPTQTAADLNSGALWTVDNIQIADSTSTPFVESFDGDGTTTTFTLSEDLGNDEDILMVFADRVRPDYVTNGTFATDTGWTKGAGWTIGAGVATATGAISTDLTQNATAPLLVAGMSYTIAFTITRSAGGVIPKIGGTSGTERTSAGTYTETIIAGSTQAITFSGNGFTGTVDAVTIKPTYAALRQILRPDEYTLVGNQLTLDEAPPTGTGNITVFAPAQLVGAANAAAAAAATSEANALTYSNAASASATAAAASAAAAIFVSGTSTTSNTVGTGAKSFTTQTGKAFAANMYLTITDQANVDNFMYGYVTSYDSATGVLIVTITQTGGSGTISAWNIALAGSLGAFGATAAGVDTLVATVPGVSTLSDGLVVFIRLAGANTTTTPTLNVSGTGGKTIVRKGGGAVAIGDLPAANAEAIFKYNAANTRWELLNPAITDGYASGFVNQIRNGAMMTWQRPTSSLSISTSGAYAADGLAVVPSGAAVTVDRVAGNGRSVYACKITGAASVTDLRVYTRVESHTAARAVSKLMLFQAYIKNSTGGSITPTLTVDRATATDNFGATASELATTNLQACADGAWTRVAYVFSASSSIGNGYQVLLQFGNNFSTTGKSITITEIDCRPVEGMPTGLATNLPLVEIRDPSADLLWNQRFFRSVVSTTASNTEIATGYVYDSTTAVFIFALTPQLRSQANAIAISNLSHFAVGIAGSTIAATSINITNANQDFISINVNVAAGLTANSACGLYMTSASAYLHIKGGEL